LLKYALQIEIAKKSLKPFILGVQSRRCCNDTPKQLVRSACDKHDCNRFPFLR